MNKGTILIATRNEISLRGNYRVIKGKEYEVLKIDEEDKMFIINDEEIDGNMYLPLSKLNNLFYEKGVC